MDVNGQHAFLTGPAVCVMTSDGHAQSGRGDLMHIRYATTYNYHSILHVFLITCTHCVHRGSKSGVLGSIMVVFS